ncbi:MAG: SDR family oxidoreductase [Nitrospinota bacterium]
MADEKVAVVTGGNRGIGFEICRQLAQAGVTVVLTARDEKKGKGACGRLRRENLDVHYHRLDVTDAKSVRDLAGYIKKEFGGFDILVNNAAVLLDGDRSGLDVEMETVRETMETNLYGPLGVSQGLIPLMKKRRSGRIVNVSSYVGAIAHLGGGYPAYRLSKASLNALTLILADELRGTRIRVNAMTPGWVRTDMGGRGAPRSVEEGADTAVWLALLADGGPTGKFFEDREVIAW